MLTDPLLAADPRRNAVVKASAGVGKTYLLVTRLIRLLLAGARPEGILAITFTRKAASEMQNRLSERLLELARADDEELEQALRHIGLSNEAGIRQRARQLYEDLLRAEHGVRTTTFHAFCQDILRRFPLEADVPPGFELMEKTGALRREAWDALYNQAAQQPDEEPARSLESLLEYCNGLHNLHQALDSFLDHRSDWWAYQCHGGGPAQSAAERLQNQLNIDENRDPVDEFVQAHQGTITEFSRLLGQHGASNYQKAARALADALAQGEPGTLFQACQQALLTQAGKERLYKPSKALAKSLGGEAMVEKFFKLREQLLAALQDTLELLAKQHTLRLNRAWYRAGQALLDHFQRLKREQRLLDFTDLEWKAYQLLAQGDNAHWVQYKLDQRIDHLLVDEFQDTNPTQWRLLLPLLEEMVQHDDRQRSVFLVGDEKQSIYGFRRADPALFDQAGNWLRHHLGADDYPMDKSRRSASAVIEAVNQTFGQGPLAAWLGDFQAHGTYQASLPGRVELLPIVEASETSSKAPNPEQLRNPLQTPRAEQEPPPAYLEGRLVAGKIRHLLAQPMAVGEGDQARPITPGDIMILLRARTQVQHFERALREAGIPYQGMDKGTLLESPEVQDIIALLDVLTMPFNDLALAQVLRSPVFMCSDDDLLRLAQNTDKQHNWLQALERLAPQLPADDSLRQAWQRLQAWRELAERLPVHDLLDAIYHQGQVMARYQAAYPPHLRQRAQGNLERLLELALAIDSGRYPSMGRFLAALGELRQHSDEAPDEAHSGTAGQQVRLMTIHAAKGLEAPVVFLAATGAVPKPRSSYQTLVRWPSDQARPSHFLLTSDQPDALSRELLAERRQREQRESANLLYVAMTRARQRLYISASGECDEHSWYQQLRQHWPRDANDQPLVLHSAGSAKPVRQAPGTPPDAPGDYPETLAPPEAAPASPAPSQLGDDPEYSDLNARLRGQLIHRLLELRTRDPAGHERQALFHQLGFELGLAHDDPLLEQAWEEVTHVITHPDLAWLFDPARYQNAYNEVSIHFDDGRHQRASGIIDRLLIQNDYVIVIDYKTHRQSRRAALAELAEHYRPQLMRYAQGVQQLWPDKAVRSGLLFTHSALFWPYFES